MQSDTMTKQEVDEMIRNIFMQQSKNEKRDKIERFKRLNQYVKKGQILFAGSSLMEQFPIYEFLQDFELPYCIYNRGVGGFTTEEMLEVLKECVYDLEPSYIFLNIGTNDLNVPDYTVERLIKRYETILTRIKDHLPSVKLFLLAYYPVNEPVGKSIDYMKAVFEHRTNKRILEANKAVEKMAECFDAKYLDLNSGITDEHGDLKAEYTIEGMHMYANGYRQVLDKLLPALMSLS